MFHQAPHGLEKVFSGRHTCQMNYKIQCFRDQLYLHYQGDVK